MTQCRTSRSGLLAGFKDEGPPASTGRPLCCLPNFAARLHQQIKHGVFTFRIAILIATGNINRLFVDTA